MRVVRLTLTTRLAAQVFDYNTLESAFLVSSMFMLLGGLIFKAAPFDNGSPGYNVTMVFVGGLFVFTLILFFGVLGFEMIQSLKFAHSVQYVRDAARWRMLAVACSPPCLHVCAAFMCICPRCFRLCSKSSKLVTTGADESAVDAEPSATAGGGGGGVGGGSGGGGSGSGFSESETKDTIGEKRGVVSVQRRSSSGHEASSKAIGDTVSMNPLRMPSPEQRRMVSSLRQLKPPAPPLPSDAAAPVGFVKPSQRPPAPALPPPDDTEEVALPAVAASFPRRSSTIIVANPMSASAAGNRKRSTSGDMPGAEAGGRRTLSSTSDDAGGGRSGSGGSAASAGAPSGPGVVAVDRIINTLNRAFSGQDDSITMIANPMHHLRGLPRSRPAPPS
jgi:uncharacterized membrane protein YgcG